MSKIKAITPKGMRDFGSAELKKRNYIFNTIKQVFEKYGYQPIETPTMENLETLTGKYGEEGNKLLFKVLDNGDYLAGADKKAIEEGNSDKLTPSIAGKGLRYDLTIPFARYVVQHQNELSFPFKRYQIQPVWRADRPQKGRYREFYQCDADVIGSKGLLNEVELINIYLEVFKSLEVNVAVKFNNRKILAGIAEALGIADKLGDFTIILDKLDKIGTEKVMAEFDKKGIPASAKQILDLLGTSTAEQMAFLNDFLNDSEIGKLGLTEVNTVLSYIDSAHLEFDVTLARGLDYYTGTIFEVVAKDAKMGSIGGGGRYDDLTGIFGLQNMSGVGISFGVERIYDVMEELGLFDKLDLASSTTKILFLNFGAEAERLAFKYVQQLREKGIASEIYPSNDKFKKQMKYADQKQIPFVAFIGDKEVKTGQVPVKTMATGNQQPYTFDEVVDLLQHE